MIKKTNKKEAKIDVYSINSIGDTLSGSTPLLTLKANKQDRTSVKIELTI